MPRLDCITKRVLRATCDSGRDSFTISELAAELSPFITGLQNLTLLVDLKAQGVAGGTFTAPGWQTRDLNTILFGADNIVKLISNEFTLFDADYLIYGYAPANQVGFHQTRVYNVTTAATQTPGISASADTVQGVITISPFSSYIPAPGAQHTFRIEHQAQNTKATNGFGEIGAAAGGMLPSGSEQYTAVWLARIT